MKIITNPLLILVLLLILFLTPLLKQGFYLSHDGEAHVARFGAYYKAYRDGQIPPRWAGDLNFGYGTPLFIFYYPLPGSIASAMHALGMSLENSFKSIIGFSFIFAPLTFYLWASLLVKREIAFIGGLLYGFAPYHFLNMYVRGDVAELLSLMLVPLVFLFIEKSENGLNMKNILFGGIVYALCILSHNAVSLMFSPVFLTYGVVRSKKKSEFLSCVLILLTGLSLSSFFWIPALLEGKFTQATFFIENMYKIHFPTLFQLLYSHWGFGVDVAKNGGLSAQIGPLHVLLALLSSVLILRKTKERTIIMYWILLFVFAVFLSIRQSDFVWQGIPLLKLFQFPWRFTALSSFITAVLGLYVLRIFHEKILIIFAALVIITSLHMGKIQGIPKKSDAFYFVYKGTTYYHGQASTIWSAGDPGQYSKNQIEIIGGNAAIKNLTKRSNLHRFIIDAASDVQIIDNTTYFPGWQVKVDNKKTPIEFQDINHRGLITFSVPSGFHKVEVRFGESPIRLFSNIVSVLTILFIIVILLQKRIHGILIKL